MTAKKVNPESQITKFQFDGIPFGVGRVIFGAAGMPGIPGAGDRDQVHGIQIESLVFA